jgi:hypothetical protein
MLMLMLIALTAQTATPTPAAKPVEEKKKCRRVETTGSIMGDRTCRTQAEWDAIDKANAANADQYRERRSH